jgi:hypothetical protein
LAKYHLTVLRPIKIDAVRLLSEFETNEIRADSTYKGMKVSVSGSVLQVRNDIHGNPYVDISGGALKFGSVRCFITSDAIAHASTLDPGQQVTLTGFVKGKSMTDVLLESCSF